MTDKSLSTLRQLLLLRYNDFKSRLTRRLGSADLAGDALQDTWLRLEDGGNIAAVHRPDNYLFRIALNIARDRQRAESRRLTTGEIGELLDIRDDGPNPAQVGVEGGGTLTLGSGASAVLGGKVLETNGVLSAGEKAPIDLKALEAFRVRAGEILPADYIRTLTVAPPGEPMGAAPDFTGRPITLAAAWTPPPSKTATSAYTIFYRENGVAKSQTIFLSPKVISAGSVIT